MKTHLYTLCWNEADMLEFFFRNYDPWVDRYIVFDDGSTDGSIEILKAHPKVELRKWHRKYPDSYLISQRAWLNEVWKESRGCADWVIMVDIDEHLFTSYSPMHELLERYKSQDISHIPALGFQILSEDFPEPDETLVQSRTWGRPFLQGCKVSIFNPDAVDETNFATGRHTAKAVGRLKLPDQDELLLFHYKLLGFERTLKKQNIQYTNLGCHDITIMYHYGWARKELRRDWDTYLKGSGDMSLPNYNPDWYPYYNRWWRLYGVLCFVYIWLRRVKKFINNPRFALNAMKRLGEYTNHEKIEQFIKEINLSPVRKEIYQLTLKGGTNGLDGNTAVISNGKDLRGVLIQCQHSADVDKLQDNQGIQKAIAEKHKNEEKYQKEFDLFVITNSNGFEINVVEFAKKSKVTLVSRKDLLEFISQIKIS